MPKIQSNRELKWMNFIVGLVVWPISSAMGMVFLNWANDYDERVPAFGFWTCFWLISAVSTFVGHAVMPARFFAENIDLRLERHGFK